MRMKNKKLYIPLMLISVFLIAFILRFWQLGNVPPSLNWDEVSWGYNALSIAETGKDEFGKAFPIVIQSLNDYKPALYLYLVSPVVAIFGLSDIAVRAPNAFAGVLAVLVAYFLVIELFPKRRDIALVSMFLFAISPWAIQFSRFAHEGMTGVLLNLLMILAFLKSFKKPYFLILSAIFAGLAIYAYQGMKLFIPLMLIVLLVSFYKEILKIPRKILFSSGFIGFMLVLPMLLYIFSTPESLSRASGASFLNDPVRVLNLRFYPERGLDNIEREDLLGQVIDNRRVLYARAIAGNYLMHFDPNFLFVKGDEHIGRHQPPYMGHLFLIELPLLLIGLYFLVFGKFRRNTKIFIFLWMLITPIGASITWDVPNSGRIMLILPTFQIITAIGIISFYFWLMSLKIKKFFKYSALSIFFVLALANFVFYLNQYFVQYNYENSQDWQYGYEELVPYLENAAKDFERIYVSNNRPLDQSYIFLLYQTRFDPETYQKNPVRNFSKYEFIDTTNFDYSNLGKYELVVVPARNFSDSDKARIIRTIKFLNGDDAMHVIRGS